MLSWNGYRYGAVIVDYYSRTADNPICKWCMILRDMILEDNIYFTKSVATPSDEFLQILLKNGLINQ